MEFPYRPELVKDAGRHFDEVVTKIQARDFRVVKPPERKICKECDLKAYCTIEGLIEDPDAPRPAAAAAGGRR